MLTYTKDINNEDILLDSYNSQIMMEWEKPLMIAMVDELQPFGDVLEIGFGMGYSATHIQTYKPKSYTIVECDPVVIKKCKEWAKDYDNVIIIESKWQDVLDDLGIYDTIFFDPTETSNLNKLAYKMAHYNWHFIFTELVIHNHMKKGSKLSVFMSTYITYNYRKFISEQQKITYYETKILLEISNNCKYKQSNKELIIPIIEKIR